MKANIIATIGPASMDKLVLKQMVESGVDIIRINSSYGDEIQYNQILQNISEIDSDKNIGVMFDIKGEDKLEFCEKEIVSHIAVSFSETKEQVLRVKNRFPNKVIVAKIESVKGVENYQEILNVSDGVMVARGDLSTAVTLERVPHLQKKFTKEALEKNKYVIAATEMLLSMVDKPFPTSAEVSDVANAVFDGVDAVMLSEETAIGKYPVESVQMMERIIVEAEKPIL